MSSTIGYRFLIGLIAAAIVGGAYIFLWPQESLQSSDPEPVQEQVLVNDTRAQVMAGKVEVSDDVFALRQEVMNLRTELAAFKHQVRSKLDALSALPSAQHEAPPQNNKDAAEMVFSAEPSEKELRAQEEADAERDRMQSLARMQTYESTLQAESFDHIWSREATDTLREVFADEALSATVVYGIECRATLCRVNVTHANPEERRQFEQTFVGKVTGILPSAVLHTEEREDGSSVSTIYLARDGHRFPRVSSSGAP